MKSVINDNRGSGIVFMAIIFSAVLLGMGALVIDVGKMTFYKSKLQNAVDAAAFAGAQELVSSDSNSCRELALEFLEYNFEDEEEKLTSEFDIDDEDKSVTVEASYIVDLHFGWVFGMNEANVTAKGTALVGPAKKISNGLRPFAIVLDSNSSYEEGQKIVLKIGKPDKYDQYGPGNYGAVDLDDNGATDYSDQILNGCEYSYGIGDSIQTLPGNKVGSSIKHGIEELIERNNGIIEICIPIVNTLDVDGKNEVEIVGFAGFEVREEDQPDDGDKDAEVEGQIIARFKRIMLPGVVDQTVEDNCLWAVNLVE